MKELPFCCELCYTNPITNNGSPYFARRIFAKLLSDLPAKVTHLIVVTRLLEGKGFFVFVDKV